jgi:hypothetical protein
MPTKCVELFIKLVVLKTKLSGRSPGARPGLSPPMKEGAARRPRADRESLGERSYFGFVAYI